ncbi:hypothetical protein HDK90DRAFT_318638 [Phyllosticta capitalensis]|uniref:Uncharacterized protein n=1 Tax=Phyllosticta capitalensis TaxID=121624 RepID=A0ABR1YII6_9PEZI
MACRRHLRPPLLSAVLTVFDKYDAGGDDDGPFLFRTEDGRAIVLIFRSDRELLIGQESCHRTQFALTLAWAITIRKAQGIMAEKIVLNVNHRVSGRSTTMPSARRAWRNLSRWCRRTRWKPAPMSTTVTPLILRHDDYMKPPKEYTGWKSRNARARMAIWGTIPNDWPTSSEPRSLSTETISSKKPGTWFKLQPCAIRRPDVRHRPTKRTQYIVNTPCFPDTSAFATHMRLPLSRTSVSHRNQLPFSSLRDRRDS